MSDYNETNFESFFKSISNVPLVSINAGYVLKDLIDILRNHNYFVDGHLATLFTNLIVLERQAIDLDHFINIIGMAPSFLVILTKFAIKDAVKPPPLIKEFWYLY